MSEAAKDQALSKLNKVSNEIGYPEKGEGLLKRRIVRSDYYGDTIRAREFKIDQNVVKLAQRVDKTEW